MSSKEIVTAKEHIEQYREEIKDTYARYPAPTGSIEAHKQALRKVKSPAEESKQFVDRYTADPRARRYAFSRHRRTIMESETEEQTNGTQHGSSEGIPVQEENGRTSGEYQESGTSAATARRAARNDEALINIDAE